MAHARTISLLLTTLALTLILPATIFADETKEFADEGFSWTVSDDWNFMEINSGEKSNGFLTRAGMGDQGGYVVIAIRSIPNTDSNFLREHTEEVRQNMAANLSETSSSSVAKGSLGGVRGTLIKIKGKNRSDLPVVLRIYGIQSNNRIYQLFMEFVSGGESKFPKEADKARRGFKLKSGGGDEPADPELAEGGGGADEDGDEEEGDEKPDGDAGTGKKPKVDGNTILFGARNLKWTIPDGSPFEWGRVTSDQTIESGVMCTAVATIELEVSEEQKARGAPTENTAEVILFIQKQGEGGDPKGMVSNQRNQTMWEKAYFDTVDFGRLKTIDKLEIGNYTGAALLMVGSTEEKRARYLRVYAAALKGVFYRWEVVLTGNSGVNDAFKGAVRELMNAVEFLDTATWVRGPLAIPAVAPHDQARGGAVGREKEVRSMGFTAKKPKPMADLNFQTGGNYRLAWEMRTEDKQNYLYFDVQTWSERSLQGTTALRNFEIDRIKEREGAWKEHAESAQTVKKGKEPYFKSNFGKGRGYGYEFAGYLDETPYVERGYVVKYKKYFYWIRYQFGGTNAEKVFAKEIKALKKAVKYSR